MAVWQFDALLVPSSEVEGQHAISPKQREDEAWWAQSQPPEHYEREISRILSRSAESTDEFYAWGESDKTRIAVGVDQGRVYEIFLRLDLREGWTETFNQVLSLAKAWNCSLVIAESLRVIRPTRDALRDAMSSSVAARFVSDPQGFLDGLSR